MNGLRRSLRGGRFFVQSKAGTDWRPVQQVCRHAVAMQIPPTFITAKNGFEIFLFELCPCLE
jgi:hypothetical protein